MYTWSKQVFIYQKEDTNTMWQDSFEQKKSWILNDISTTLGGIRDASPKGSIDELCLPIMETINAHKDMVTTSSCSGRVSVFLEGYKVKEGHVKVGAKGDGGRWLFVTHDKNQLEGWYRDPMFHYQNTPANNLDEKIRYVLFKFEPLILHVKCRDFETASTLYTTAMNCGFRESGINVHNIVAIKISMKLDIPIGYYNEKEDRINLFVDQNYLEIVTKGSLSRFNENERKLTQLHSAVGEIGVIERPETKEERRERMKRAGLERQKQAQEEKVVNSSKVENHEEVLEGLEDLKLRVL
jgi:tRNA wybutosine-synthesizing protein 3